MRRPPLWAWALPAAVALGLAVGVRLRPPQAVQAATPVIASLPAVRARVPAVPERDSLSLDATDTPFAPVDALTVGWGADGGGYQPLDGSAAGVDTLPGAPVQVALDTQAGGPSLPDPAPPAPAPVPVVPDGPAQDLRRDAALAVPLIAVVRGGGRLTFYSAWDAPAARAGLAGEWSAVGDCSSWVRLGYEQAAPGLGAVRGAGAAVDVPPWSVALVFPRQHCAAAGSRWTPARPAVGDETGILRPLLRNEPVTQVVRVRDRVWAASRGSLVAGHVTAAGEPAATWSAMAPTGSTARLLGVWDGDAVFVAMEGGGRVVRIWRVPG